MRYEPLPQNLTRSETTWGIRYLLFQLVFLPPLLDIALHAICPRYSGIHLNLAYFAVNFVAVLWIFRGYLRASAAQLRQRIVPSVTAVLGGYLSYRILTLLLAAVTRRLMPDFFNVNDAAIGSYVQISFWLMAVGTVVLAPVAEELFYRALVFGTLHRRSRILAYCVSTLIFCLIHVSGYMGSYDLGLLLLCALQYVPGGLVLAWAYEYSGSIFAPMAIHILINAIGTFSMR